MLCNHPLVKLSKKYLFYKQEITHDKMVSREKVNQIIVVLVLCVMLYYAYSHGMLLEKDPAVVLRGGRPKKGVGFFLYPTEPSFYVRGDNITRMREASLRDREGMELLTALCRHASERTPSNEKPTMYDVGSEFSSWGTVGGMMGVYSVIIQPKHDVFDYAHKTTAFMRIGKYVKIIRRSLTDYIVPSKGLLVYNHTHSGVVLNGTVKNSDVPATITMATLMAEATDSAKQIGADTPFLVHIGTNIRVLPSLESISESPSFDTLIVDVLSGRSLDHFQSSPEQLTNRLAEVSRKLSDNGYSLFVLPGRNCPLIGSPEAGLTQTTIAGVAMFLSKSSLASQITALSDSSTSSFCRIMWAREDHFTQGGFSLFYVFIFLKFSCVAFMCLRKKKSDKGRVTR